MDLIVSTLPKRALRSTPRSQLFGPSVTNARRPLKRRKFANDDLEDRDEAGFATLQQDHQALAALDVTDTPYSTSLSCSVYSTGVLHSPNAVSPNTALSRSRRDRRSIRSRQSSAAAAAAAMAQTEGHKPREERGWEEFHPDLDIEVKLPVFSAKEVDRPSPDEVSGTVLVDPTSPLVADFLGLSEAGSPHSAPGKDVGYDYNPSAVEVNLGDTDASGDASAPNNDTLTTSPIRRRPGRPPRRQATSASTVVSPFLEKILPLPAQNPRERLSLPKPTFRNVDTFASYEQDQSVQINYVDRTMASVGYQESDIFLRPEKTLIRAAVDTLDEDLDLAMVTNGEMETTNNTTPIGRVEYDMDEQDDKWLEVYNVHRKSEGVDAIKPAIFEFTITLIEKEWHTLERRN